MILIRDGPFRSGHKGTFIIITITITVTVIVIRTLTDITSPLPRLREALGVAFAHVAALAQQDPRHRPAPRPHPQAQERQNIEDAVNPPAPVDPGVQAARFRIQRQLVEAQQARIEDDNRARDEQGANNQAAMIRIGVAREHRRQQLHFADQWHDELARQRHLQIPRAQNMPHPFGMDGPAINARDIGAGAVVGNGAGNGVGNGVAFGGLNADWERRMRLDRWFEEQRRNMPRQ